MKISVLLNNVTQEQSSEDDESAFFGWLHMPGSGTDGGNLLQQDENGSRFGSHPLPRLTIRKEEWGGVVVHGPSMMVFQVDTEGYRVFEQLVSGATLAEALVGAASSAEVAAFCASLSEYDLV